MTSAPPDDREARLRELDRLAIDRMRLSQRRTHYHRRMSEDDYRHNLGETRSRRFRGQ